MLKWVLVIIGVLAALALAVPSLVSGALFFFIIPGVILGLAPTAFIYLGCFAAIRVILPIQHKAALNGGAAAIVLALGWLAAQPSVMKGRETYDRLHDDDIVPAKPVTLAGHIRLEISETYPSPYESGTDCDKLCAALLRTPGVESLTIIRNRGDNRKIAPVTWRLAPRGSVPDRGLLPVKPEDILAELPPAPEKPAGPRNYPAEIDARKATRQAIAAEWSLRLSRTETLVSEAPRKIVDMTIRIIDERIGGASHKRFELLRGGTVLLRRVFVRVPVLAAPVGYWPNLNKGSWWEWGTSYIANASHHAELEPIRFLFEHTTLARPMPAEQATTELRARLVEALDNPRASNGELALAQTWNESFDYRKPTGGPDAELMARIIADPRFNDLSPFLKNLKPSPELRDAAGRRILHPDTSKQDRLALATLLYNFPKGSLAQLTPVERRILADPVLRLQAAPLMTRTADAGPQALPDLIKWLRTDALPPFDPKYAYHTYTKAEKERTQALKYVRRALARLGPQAAPALPLVLELFGDTGERLCEDMDGAREWRIAMLRMGLPPERLPWWEHSTAEQIAKDRARIDVLMKRHDAFEDNGYY